MAQPFQNIGQRPFEAQNFRPNFRNNFDTVVVSGFPRYIRTKQIVDFFILKEGDCVCVATKNNPPSVLLQFSSPVVAEKVVLRYNNSEVCGQRLKVFPSNNQHSGSPQVHGKPAEILPLMSNDVYIPSRRVQVPLQPVTGTSLLNLAKALLIQKNNLNALQNQWKSQTSSPQRNFPSWGSPTHNQQQIVADRRNVWRPSDNPTRHGQKDTAEIDPTSHRSDKNSLVKKQETAQEVSCSTDKFPKDKSIKRNEEIKGPVIRRKRLRRRRSRERNIERTTQTAVSKGSLRVTSLAGKNMDKNDSSSLRNASQDSEMGRKCSTNNNKNNETGSKATMEKPFDGCKINTEGGMETKPKEDGASTDGGKSKSTASGKENPASHGSGSEKECLTRIDCKKDKGADKTIPNDSVIKNEKRAAGMKDKSGEEGSQGTASKHEYLMEKSDIKDNEGCNHPTQKDSALENESPNGSVTNKSNDTYIGNEITKKNSSNENENTGDVAKNKDRDTESRISTVGFAGEKKFVTRKIGDKENVEEGDIKANDCCTEKNCSTGDMDVNLGTTQDSSGNKCPNTNNDKRNVGTGSEIVSTQNKDKTEPQNVNVKNRDQAARNPQNLYLENRQKKDEKGKRTGSGLKKQRRSSKDDELKQVNDSLTAAQKNLTQRNSTTSKLAKNNKDTLSDSKQPHAPRNMENGGKPKSFVSKDDAPRKHCARRNEWDRIRYRRKVNELSPRARSFFPYRNRVSPSRDARVSGRTRSPDRTLLRNHLVRSSDEGRARKRVFEVTGLVVSSPKRKYGVAPKKVSDTALEATSLVVAPRKGSCLDDQSITCTDKNGPKKAGSQNESVPKKAIDTAFKATGLVVAPPKRKSLNNATDNKDRIDPKNVADTTFKVTGLVLAPPKKMCLDEQSTKKKKIGSPNEFVPKNVIDPTFKATGFVVAPPRGGCLDNKSSQSNNDKMGPKGVFGLMDLRDVVIERHSEQRFGTMKEQKNNNQKRSDYDIRLSKQSDPKNFSTRKNKKGKESSPMEISSKDSNLKRSDCLNFGKGQTASDALNSSMKDSSKNLEERGMTTTKTSAKDGTQKNGDDPNLATVQAVNDMLETFDIIVDLSMRKKRRYHGSTTAKTSVGDTTVESNDCTNNDKVQSQGNALKNSDLIMDSLNNLENDELTVPKCSSEPDNHQGSSDCTDFDKKDVVGHELENFIIRKELYTQEKPVNNRLTSGNKCSEYFQKSNDGTNLGKVKLACDVVKNSATRRKSDNKGLAVTSISSKQNDKKNYDGPRLCRIQVASDSLKNSESLNNMSTPNTPRDGANQNKIKEGCKENPILVSEGHIDVKEHNLTKENQHLVKQVQGNDSHEKDLYRKIPVSPCTAVRSLNVSSNSESSSGVKDEHTTFNKRNSDKRKGSLTADIVQRNMKNTDYVTNTDCLKDSLRGHVEAEAGDRDQFQDENIEQDSNPLKKDFEQNACYVGQVSHCVGTTDHSENENSKANQTIQKLSDKVSSKENCRNRNVLESQESLPTVSKTVPSKTTTLASCVSNMLAKLKTLKTNAQKISKNQGKANATTSKDKSISVKINSALHSSHQENENSAESLTANPNRVLESKSVFVKDSITTSAETQSGPATVSKYFACQKNSFDKESNGGVCGNNLEPGFKKISGSNQDCSNCNHKSTDVEQQLVITCDSVEKAVDNFPNSSPANEILPQEVAPIVSTVSRKSFKPQSDGKMIMICTAKSDEQKVDKGENEETETSKSAEPNGLSIGANVPINMQSAELGSGANVPINIESRARVKDIEISDPKVLPACISETLKEDTTSEVFSQKNILNVLSDVAEQPKVVCGSSGTKSSSTTDGVASLKKSTTITLAPALLATEEVKRLETDVVLVTEDHPMCIDLSSIDLQNNNTRIASTGISDVKKETQFQNEPSFANGNSSFENNAPENNQEQEPTIVTCDDVNTASNENYGFPGNKNTQMLLSKDLQSGCHSINGGNSVQSSVTCTDGGRGQNVNYLSVNCQEILNQSEYENLSNGGSSVQNDRQDGNLTGVTAIAGKRKREDEPVDLTGSKHQKCQNPSQGKSQLNEAQSNQDSEQSAGVEGMKLSEKERKGQEQERRFLCKNILAIEEQYDKESVALLKNVKMLASVDPSLTEKLKDAFKDSLAEIGRKYLFDLHKLKEKNDNYKNQRKNAADKGAVPPRNPKNRQGLRTRRNRAKAKTRQSNANIQQKKGKAGNVNQKNATKKQQGTGKTVNNGQINKQQTMGKMVQNKLQMNAFNASQGVPYVRPRVDNSQRNLICNV